MHKGRLGHLGHASPSSSTDVSSDAAAATQIARKPNLAPDDVHNILMLTAKDLGPKGRDDQFGAGLIDACRALMAVEPPSAAACIRN